MSKGPMDVLGGALLWAGLLGAIAGLLSLVKWRRRGAKMLAAGVLMFAAGVYLPIRETHISVATTRLDDFAPVASPCPPAAEAVPARDPERDDEGERPAGGDERLVEEDGEHDTAGFQMRRQLREG